MSVKIKKLKDSNIDYFDLIDLFIIDKSGYLCIQLCIQIKKTVT